MEHRFCPKMTPVLFTFTINIFKETQHLCFNQALLYNFISSAFLALLLIHYVQVLFKASRDCFVLTLTFSLSNGDGFLCLDFRRHLNKRLVNPGLGVHF
jgi:hypothetical protein